MAKEKLTRDGIAEAVRMKRAGVAHRDIAAYIGVAEATFSRWINHPKTENQRQLCQAMKKAEADRKAALLTIIYNAAAGDPRRWQAAAWLLERQYPDEFSQHRKVTAEADVDLAPVFVFEPEEAGA